MRKSGRVDASESESLRDGLFVDVEEILASFVDLDEKVRDERAEERESQQRCVKRGRGSENGTTRRVDEPFESELGFEVVPAKGKKKGRGQKS